MVHLHSPNKRDLKDKKQRVTEIRWDGGKQGQNSGTTGNSERAFDFGVIDTIKPYCILQQESRIGSG